MAAQPDIIMVDSESDSGDSQEIEFRNNTPRHNFVEVFSPPIVTFACQRQGLLAEHGIDILTGFDLNTFEGRAATLQLLKARPRFLMLSPPRTMYSALQGLFNLHKMNPQVLQQRMGEADSLLKFAIRHNMTEEISSALNIHIGPLAGRGPLSKPPSTCRAASSPHSTSVRQDWSLLERTQSPSERGHC